MASTFSLFGRSIDVRFPLGNLSDLFVREVNRHPDKLAIILEDQSMTYGELYSLVYRLACRLSCLTNEGDIVCQCLERSIEMVVGILAIFMCKAVYCPLSPYDPDQRRRILLNETRTKLVLVHQRTKDLFLEYDHVRVLAIDQEDINDSSVLYRSLDDRSNLAFLVFTSGSTGTPKGVPVGHENFVYYLSSMCEEGYISENDILIQISRDTFDAHLQEILGAVLIGGTCLLLSPKNRISFNIPLLVKTIRDHHGTFLNLVPSLSIALIDYLKHSKEILSSSLRLVISTGEPLPRLLAGELLSSLGSQTSLYNTYGLTETTVDVTYRRVYESDTLPSLSSPFVPIGLPLPNYICHLVGEEGELFIGGPGVFRGYLNGEDSRLMMIHGDLCYRTGDLVKIINDELIYVGRKDFQVKIRGQRIETGEIESVLLRESHKHINGCLVLSRNEQLVAYVQSREWNPNLEEDVKRISREYLPLAMTISHVIVLEQFPLNANGKIDRSRLPDPSFISTIVPIDDEPQTEMEFYLQKLWCELLKVEQISLKTDFFSLGAHSLHLMLAINEYSRQYNPSGIDLGLFFQRMTISDHAKLLSRMSPTDLISPLPVNPQSDHSSVVGPLSFAQESIWLDEQMRFQKKGEGNIYHMIYVFRLSSTLDVSRFGRSLEQMVEKHQPLRSSFTMLNGELIQRVLPRPSLDEILFHSSVENEEDLETLLQDEETNQSNLDITRGRVFRCHLIRSDSYDTLLFQFHHLVFDGTSEQIFFNELNQFYTHGESYSIVEQTFNYLDYARWERTLDMTNDEIFWREHLHGCQINPFVFSEEKIRTGKGSSRVIEYFHGDQLIDYAAHHHVTLFQLCLAICSVFVFKLNGNEDFLLGGLVANRMRRELHSLIGMFVHLIPYRIRIPVEETFPGFLQRIQHLCSETVHHSSMPFQYISQFLPSDHPISTIVDFQMIEEEYFLGNNLSLQQIVRPVRMTQFDLSFVFQYNSSKKMITAAIEYSTDLFTHSTIEVLTERFEQLIEQILSDDQHHLYRFNLLLPNEKQILDQFNPREPLFQEEECIHWRFIRHSLEHPQKLAVLMEEQSLTYNELLFHAQQLSLHLIKQCHVQLDDFICQYVERSIEMVIGILAIWMCGGIYTPFSPRDPIQRHQQRIKHLNPRVLIEHHFTRHSFDENEHLIIVQSDQINETMLDLNLFNQPSLTSEHLSHIVFTSGSTGEPKMVEIRHRNFVSYIKACLYEESDIVLQQASVAFDSHLEEIMGPLITHGQLAILKPEPYHLDMDYFSSSISRHQVTFLFPVPTLLIMLTNFLRTLPEEQQTVRLQTLRFLSCGGEKLYMITVRDILPFLKATCSIHNYYGPAECTLATLHYQVQGDEEEETIGLPIGTPMTNARVFLLDQYLERVPPDSIGEIVIGGDGVFAGYRNQADLTREVLIEYDGLVCYRTGDLGRLNSKTGQIDYLGRKDHQVKLRGQRIELDEIEHTIISSTSQISHCLVIKLTHQSVDHLVAYIQTDQSNLLEHIREYCIDHLSPFMVPSFFLFLKQFPLTLSGKIDRKHLPSPNFIELSSDDQNPSPLEQQLLSIFTRAFDLPSSFDVNATFSQLGGTSLGIVKALTFIRQEQLLNSHSIDITTLLNNPSVRRLAHALQSLRPSVSENIDDQPLSPTVHRSIVIETLGIVGLLYVFLFPIYLSFRTSLLILAPVVHLFSYILLKKVLLPTERREEGQVIYSSDYYRWWFVQRLWKLNTIWHEMLFGTSLYNSYLRLCGAQIGRNVHLRTNRLDRPDLLRIGENSFLGEDVILSSLQYTSPNLFQFHPIEIGRNCSIGARSVLSSEVSLDDHTILPPLTSTYQFHHQTAPSLHRNPTPIKTIISLIGVWIVHQSLFLICTYLSGDLYSFRCLLWLLGCLCVTLIGFKWILPRENECWWMRHLIVVAFGFSLRVIFDGADFYAPDQTYPRILRWLNRCEIGSNFRLAMINDLLRLRSSAVKIGSNVTLGADVLFHDHEEEIGQIRIEDDVSVGNDCVIQMNTSIPSKCSVGAMTRVDCYPKLVNENEVILGIPARPTSLFISTNDDIPQELRTYSFIRIIGIRYVVLLVLIGTFHWLIAPLWILLFGMMVSLIYTPEDDSSFISCVKVTLINDFRMFVGPFLGGSVWLNRYLNSLGGNIHSSAFISDIDCIDDPQLISIDRNVYIESGSRIQGHTNEHRHYYLEKVSIGVQCHLMNSSFILPGCHLQGKNRIYPCTLIIKGDQLPFNTHWRGSPATAL